LSDDQILVEAFLKGESSSLETLIEKHWKKVFNLCWRLLGNREDAEEATQRVFISVFCKISKFRGDSSFNTWLFSITLNECRMSERRAVIQKAPIESADNLEDSKNPESELYSKERIELLKKEILNLPFKQRAVIALRINEELAFKDIADALQCSVNSAKVNFQHGINRLKEMMGNNENKKK
jgi:RNA polymerase sigma-70 factor (ECF subfamily)